jgi:hypothetical protein
VIDHTMTDRRTPDQDGDERALLLDWLGFHRDTLAAKCAGLSRTQLVEAAVPPSNLSLLGLVRHLTEMERVYLIWGIGGGPLTLHYCSDADPEADFAGAATAGVDATMQIWARECAAADELVAAVPDLDAPGEGNGYSLRWNLLKVIGEYARHNGHADLLRETIDGSVGE